MTHAVDRRLERDPIRAGRAISQDGEDREWRAAAFNGAVRVTSTVFAETAEVVVQSIGLIPPAD